MNYFNYYEIIQGLIVAILGPFFIFIFKNIFELIRFKNFENMIKKDYFNFIDYYVENKDLEKLRVELENKAKRLSRILEKEITFLNFENSIKYVRLIDYVLVTYGEIDKIIKSYGFRNLHYDKHIIDKENESKLSKINKIVENHKGNISKYINLKSDKLVSDL